METKRAKAGPLPADGFAAGQEAAKAGKGVAANPYPATHAECRRWKAGWEWFHHLQRQSRRSKP